MVNPILRFNKDLKKFSTTMDLSLGVVVKKVSLDMFAGVIRKTPVDTGRARSSWNIAVGKPDLSVAPVGGASQKSSNSKAAAFDNPDPYSKVFITNNLDYIEFLEQGSSKQAPLGMVKVTVLETLNFLRSAFS